MSRDLVVFGEDWGAHPSSTQHIVRRLAADRRVMWVNSIGLRRPRLDARDLGRLARKASALVSGQGGQSSEHAARPDTLCVVSPFAAPFPGSALADTFNRCVLGAQLRRAAERQGFRDPLLWTSLPTAAPLLGALGERGVVYYCGDDFGALAGVDHAPVLRMERDLVERADLVLAASEQLAARFPGHKTQLAPHGVDLDLFARPTPAPDDLPKGKPIAGFYGSLADWIDVDMLANAARIMPDWNFVLIGPAQTDISSLHGLPNVHLMGPRAHAELPGYCQNWTVSLLPFRDNAQIRACNPLKLREYLAAGTPVATTLFPALVPYEALVSVAYSPCAFADSIRAAAGDTARNADRRARVADESWSARAHAISNSLEAL
jgi:glycosyltransferase involved in cell wall biosynthesis